MTNTSYISIKSISSVKRFNPENNFFYLKSYIEKSSSLESVCFTNIKYPNLKLTDQKTNEVVGIFESYWPIKYGLTKQQSYNLGCAFDSINSSKNKWMAAFKAVNLLYQSILIMYQNETFKNEIYDHPIEVSFTSDTDDTCYFVFKNDTIQVNYDGSNTIYEDLRTVKDAFKYLLQFFTEDKVNLDDIQVNLCDNYTFTNDFPSAYNWMYIVDDTLPISAITSYKSLYKKTFPNIKVPSAYSFYAVNGFGDRCSAISINIDKHQAYKDFKKKYSLNISAAKKPWVTPSWKLCEESEGVRLW